MRKLWCVLLLLAIALICCAQLRGDTTDLAGSQGFYHSKIGEMQSEIDSLVAQARSVRALAVLVAVIGVFIGFATAERWRPWVRILGTLVSMITIASNIWFDGDHRDLFRRATLCNLYLDEATLLESKAFAVPPLLPLDTFEVAFRKCKNDFWRMAQPEAPTDIKYAMPEVPATAIVRTAGFSPIEKAGSGALSFVGFARAEGRSAALALSERKATENAAAFLEARLQMLSDNDKQGIDIVDLANYLVKSATRLSQDFTFIKDRNLFKAETTILLDKRILLDDLDYYSARKRIRLPNAVRTTLAEAEPIPRSVYYHQDSVRAASTRPSTTALISPNRVASSPHVKWGCEGPVGLILEKRFFTINYDSARKIPAWSAFYITADDLVGSAERSNDYREDVSLPDQLRSRPIDYTGSGYDRATNAPSSFFTRSAQAMSASFLMSNVSPRTRSLNRRVWPQLDKEIAQAIRYEGEGWLFIGNAFLDDSLRPAAPEVFIGPDSVAVPTHCYAVVLTYNPDGGYSACAFLLPNIQIPAGKAVNDYMVTVDRLEEVLGCDFYVDLPDDVESIIESKKPTDWPPGNE